MYEHEKGKEGEKVTQEGLKKLLSQGEGIEFEFKECKNKTNPSLYEPVCSFANRL